MNEDLNDLNEFLTANGLVEAGVGRRWSPLTGGVSSDIWRVDLDDGRTLCVKRALAKLKVAADWQAPVSRNAFEWAWINVAAGVLPHAVPRPLAHDEARGLFAMNFLDPSDHPVWKQQLLSGHVDARTASAVGKTVGLLHQASAHRADLKASFDTGDSFYALRLEPYLLATAGHHPDLADALKGLVARTAGIATALVHGDVSPKNILIGPGGPVILDAECAWYGDPAFDLAFCLNHLLLKRLPRPDCSAQLHEAFSALVEAYFGSIEFEPRIALEMRAATLLPALLLARVDGKSPVEYITSELDRETVRRIARPLIKTPVDSLGQVARAWFDQ